jgi:putative NADH-flavin reductase
MKLIVVGATGRTGRHVIDEALMRGHSVTAVVSQTGSLDPRDGLLVAPGDPLQTHDLERLLPRHDAVISCLGRRSRADPSLLRDAAAATVATMASSGLRRYLLVSQGLLFPGWNPMLLILRLMLRSYVADSSGMERLVSASDTDWTIVRPPRLLDGGAAHGYKVKVGARPSGSSAMQRRDLAAFMVDAVEKRAHLREIVGIASG